MPAPDAQLLLSTHCPHCPAVLAALADLVKQGAIGRLEAVNLEQHPEVGQALGVRSVPWIRVGRIELAGLVQDGIRHADLANIVDERPAADFVDSAPRQAQLAGQIGGVGDHAPRVPFCLSVAQVERGRQGV